MFRIISLFRSVRPFGMSFSTSSTVCDAGVGVESLKWLLGRWVGKGEGKFATIDAFTYGEEMEMKEVAGKPLITYNMKSWNLETKTPLHAETGFIKINPDTKEVAFVLAHNFGLVEMSEGQVSDTALSVSSTSIGRVSFNKEPSVLKVERDYKLSDGNLQYELRMQTTNQPLQKHLEGRLEKVE